MGLNTKEKSLAASAFVVLSYRICKLKHKGGTLNMAIEKKGQLCSNCSAKHTGRFLMVFDFNQR